MTTTTTSTTSADAVDPDLVATIRDLLAAHVPGPHTPEDGVALDGVLWAQLEDLGLARLTGAEADGGSGAGWLESAALLTEMASYAVSLPVGEHDLLAGWLLGVAGLPADAALRTVAVVDASGAARAVPWARYAEKIVCLSLDSDHGWRVTEVAASEVSIEPAANLAGEPRDHLQVDTASLTGPRVGSDVREELRLRAALVRAIQVTGALERCLALAIEHTTTRVQFGRPLARFQAVQHLLADVAAETSLARAAVDAAVRAAATGADLAFPVAVARSCAGHATSVVVRHSHQLHGAIGTTLEHDLHRFTLSALAWRSEYGSTDYWDRQVADLARQAGRDALWPLLTR